MGTRVSIMRRIVNQQGLTLVEMLVSLAVLSIFVVVIVQSVGFNFISTVFIGEKSQANVIATKKVEEVHAIIKNSQSLTDEELLVYLQENVSGYKASDILHDYEEDLQPQFYVEPITNQIGEGDSSPGYNVTVVVFYKNGQVYVELPRFIGRT